KQAHLKAPIIAGSNSSQMLAPTIIPALHVETATQPSPDGTHELVLKTTHTSNSILSYILTATDATGNNAQTIYTASSSASEAWSIPFNTWSPDDTYVFIQKADGDALVFDASGKEIVPGQMFLDVGSVFSAGGRTDSYHETTGWASPTLLIINTTKSDNTKSSSYWFEVPTQAIIQLSSQF